MQGEMQSLPNRDHAHSKLFTVTEISMSFMCFFWNRAISSHNPETTWCLVQLLQQTMSLLIQIIVAVPKLAKQDCGWAREPPLPSVPDEPIHSASNSTEVPATDCERNLCVIWSILWTCWIPESTLNQPAAKRAGVITTPSSQNRFIIVHITHLPLAYAGGHRAKAGLQHGSSESQRALFFQKKFFSEEKQVISHTWKAPTELTEPSRINKEVYRH